MHWQAVHPKLYNHPPGYAVQLSKCICVAKTYYDKGYEPDRDDQSDLPDLHAEVTTRAMYQIEMMLADRRPKQM